MAYLFIWRKSVKMKDIKNKIKYASKEVRDEIRQKTIGYMLAAFGFVAALAWNEAIKGLIEYFFPIGQNTILAKFIYAMVITFVVVTASIYLAKLLDSAKEEK